MTSQPTTDEHQQTRPPSWPALVVGILAALGAIGSAVMSLAHLDVRLPVISELGPTGRVLLPVAVGFAIGAVAFAAVAYGAFARRRWAWPAALVLNAIALASAVMPWRGIEMSGAPALVTLVALVVLVSAPGRATLLYRSPG